MNKFLEKSFRTLGGDKALSFIARSSDLMLAAIIVAILMMLIFPVPPPVIDILITINLAVSISLLFVALYLQKAVHLSIFPSLLLITTLYRLGLNISSTRQILLKHNAGKIIHAFGSFVVGGNYVVGGVVFLIITIVQFIVVTKGAERVAEVAARFTLDAMPGKQMSIDADLRAGIIDQQQARELRLGLSKESQLYGAMDGAMKFVKGDAIAGIVIAIINIIGGLIIGVTQHHMTASQAAKIYTLLSIGDGLVSQIPSLMIAITAGIVTTRVSSEKRDANLGKEISEQLLKQPKALLLSGCVLLLMGLIPGFPFLPFATLGSLVGSLGFVFNQSAKKMAAKAAVGVSSMETEVEGHAISAGGAEDFALTLPVVLELGVGISSLLKKDRQGLTFIDQMLPKMRHALYSDLGVRFPGVHLRIESSTIEKNEYAIHLNEVPIIRGKIIMKHLLTNESEEILKKFQIPFVTSASTNDMPTLWVEERYQEVLQKVGIRFWTGLEVIILHLTKFYKQFASEFIGIQEVRSMLEFVEKSFPDLVKEVTRLVPLQKMTDIMKRLVQEQISVKDTRTILESLSDWAQAEKDPILLTEYIRSSLKRYISYKYSLGQTVLSVYLLDPEIEDMIRGAVKQTSMGAYLSLDTDSVQLILHAMRSTVKPATLGGQPPVLLTAMEVRRFARKLIESEFPDIAVISFQEIVPEIKIQPLGRVQL